MTQLEREAQLVVRGAPPRDQIAVDVVQEEEPLQLGAGRLLGERPVRLSLLISQKLHRHERTVASTGARPAIFPRTPAGPPAGVLADHDRSQRQPLYRCFPRP
jgi:hypothetical protein